MIKKNSISAFIYARMNSTRLPGKVLMNFYGKSMLKIIIEKIESIGIKPIVVTSNQSTDNELIENCIRDNISYFRGDLNNVALRTVDALKEYDSNYFFRINGDSPFLYPSLLKKIIDIQAVDSSFDLYTNIQKRTYPYGVAVELIRSETFLSSYQYFDDYNKEHITSYFYNNQKKFWIKNIECKTNLSNYSLTIDTYEDMDKIINLINYYNDDFIFNLPLESLINKIIKYEKSLFN